jgi:ribosomal-protein-alanine N-acetyltransferase
MGRAEVVRCGTGRVRVGPWRGHPHIAHLSPFPGRPPDEGAVAEVLRGLAGQGYREVLTSALARAEQDAFLSAGFEVHERLHLLRHDLRPEHLPPATAPRARVRLRRARRADRPRVLGVDSDAFTAFWRLDETGLVDALSATPVVRFRVAPEARRSISGYAVWGRAGPVSYLQRLAVDPDHQGRGIGTALVVDGLAWSRRRTVDHVLVNTQEENATALALYEKLGFERQAHGLAVLSRSLDDVL